MAGVAAHSTQVPDGATEFQAWKVILDEVLDRGMQEGFLSSYELRYFNEHSVHDVVERGEA